MALLFIVTNKGDTCGNLRTKPDELNTDGAKPGDSITGVIFRKFLGENNIRSTDK